MRFNPRHHVKSLLARLVRPGVAGLERRQERIDAALRALAPRLEAVEAAIGRVEARLGSVPEGGAGERKYEEELRYWRWLIKTDEGRRSLPAPFDAVFGRWQRDRLRELARFLDLPAGEGDGALDGWCAACSAVEIGGGPYPALAAAPAWRRAVAVDPLARGYAREGLLPATAGHVTFLEACGEHVPLPDSSADLVIIENALDHVSDPAGVVAECRRLLRPDGLLWLLVDLSTYRDHMHPHPFDERSIRALVAAAGFEVVRDRVTSHHSHPKAFGEYRALLRKPAGPGAAGDGTAVATP